jgi:acetyl esterase/lipase
MRWFWDYYAEPADRTDPRVAPLRGHLDGLPPACVVTADFDPLRDEGLAYADALEAAGVPVRLIRARGHTHTSITMVDVVISGAPVRSEIGAALSGFFAVAPSGLTDSRLTDSRLTDSGLTDRAGAR